MRILELSVLRLLLTLIAGCAQNGGDAAALRERLGELDKAAAAKPNAQAAGRGEPGAAAAAGGRDAARGGQVARLALRSDREQCACRRGVHGDRLGHALQHGGASDIKEKISVNLQGRHVFEALDTLREIYGYEYKVQGNRILIQPLTLQTRVFQVNYLYNQRKGRSELRVSSGAISDSPRDYAIGRDHARSPARRALTTQSAAEQPRRDHHGPQLLGRSRHRGARDHRHGGRPQRDRQRRVGHRAGARAAGRAARSRQLPACHAGRGRAPSLARGQDHRSQLTDNFATGINWGAFRTGGNSRVAGGVCSRARR